MKIEMHVPSAVKVPGLTRRRLKSALRSYQQNVGTAALSVFPALNEGAAGQQVLSFTCRIELQVRWWGRMTVEHSDPNPGVAIGRAIAKMEELLEAFARDVPTHGHSHAA